MSHVHSRGRNHRALQEVTVRIGGPTILCSVMGAASEQGSLEAGGQEPDGNEQDTKTKGQGRHRAVLGGGRDVAPSADDLSRSAEMPRSLA